MKSPITSHVLDTALGRPAAGIEAVLEYEVSLNVWNELARSITNDDGRITDLLPPGEPAQPGSYRLTFNVAPYLHATNTPGFYSQIPIIFTLTDPAAHYHIPLLLSPFGYSTYRGS